MKPTRLNKLLMAVALAAPTISHAAAPGAPSIEWMETNFALIEINEQASAYKDLVTVKDYAEVPVSWTKWSGGSATQVRYMLDGVVIKQQSLSGGSATQTGQATLQVTKGGQYQLDVELCNSDGCTNSVAQKLVKVEDTDGSHMDPIVLNSGENHQSYENTSGKVVGTYFTEWGVYGRNFTVDKIPANNLTHILYGFIPICGPNQSLQDANPTGHNALVNSCAGSPDFSVTIHDIFAAATKTQSGQVSSDSYRGNFGQLMAMKQAYPDLKVLPSIGGWTLSDPFYYLGDTAKRATFVSSVKAFLQTWKFFDGVDIDWEYPGGGGANSSLGNSATDGDTYVALMQELRAMLDELETETGRDYELTSAIGVGAAKLANVDYGQAQSYMDYIFMMSYDFYGAWDFNKLGHQTGLYAPEFRPNDELTQSYTVDAATRTLLGQGVPSNKLIVGAAMYARGWSGVNGYDSTSHLSGQATGAIPGTWEAGILDYREIATMVASPEWDYYYDTTAEAPYIFNPSNGNLASFDDARSVNAKGSYVLNHQLGGLFSWEIDADNGDILNAMHEGLGHGDGTNNRSPVARAGQDQSVVVPATVTVDGSSSNDPDNDNLTYSWAQTAGPSVNIQNPHSAIMSFDVADVTGVETITLSLTVNDGELSASDSVNITLNPATVNMPPIADAGADISVNEQTSAVLNASASSDPENAPLSYSWSQISGTAVSIANTNSVQTQFTAPNVDTTEQLVFEVTVSDGEHTATDQIMVTVLPVTNSNQAPSIDVISSVTLNERDSLQVAATVTDADGDPITLSWAVSSPLSATGTNTATVTVTAPSVDAATDYQITLTADDGQATSTATVMIRVSEIDDGNDTCSNEDPNASNYTAWDAGTVYNTSDRVSYNSLVWEAKWWTQGNTPANDGGPWTLISAIEAPWDATVPYSGADQVNYLSRRYEAKWWTKGDEPGVAGVWIDVGEATCQ